MRPILARPRKPSCILCKPVVRIEAMWSKQSDIIAIAHKNVFVNTGSTGLRIEEKPSNLCKPRGLDRANNIISPIFEKDVWNKKTSTVPKTPHGTAAEYILSKVLGSLNRNVGSNCEQPQVYSQNV